MKPHQKTTEDNPDAMEASTESNDEPIVMVNLEQVRPHAEYDDPVSNDCTGLEALARCPSGSDAVSKEVG
ncbi:hypothetical protein OBB00_05900 [Gammaproteobacteria bacterium]|nr:hypothetical protein [Gammaproteobacteria bacterium]